MEQTQLPQMPTKEMVSPRTDEPQISERIKEISVPKSPIAEEKSLEKAPSIKAKPEQPDIEKGKEETAKKVEVPKRQGPGRCRVCCWKTGQCCHLSWWCCKRTFNCLISDCMMLLINMIACAAIFISMGERLAWARFDIKDRGTGGKIPRRTHLLHSGQLNYRGKRGRDGILTASLASSNREKPRWIFYPAKVFGYFHHSAQSGDMVRDTCRYQTRDLELAPKTLIRSVPRVSCFGIKKVKYMDADTRDRFYSKQFTENTSGYYYILVSFIFFFTLIVTLAECRNQWARSHFSFLDRKLGRGLFIVFLALMIPQMGNGVSIAMSVIANLIGFLNILVGWGEGSDMDIKGMKPSPPRPKLSKMKVPVTNETPDAKNKVRDEPKQGDKSTLDQSQGQVDQSTKTPFVQKKTLPKEEEKLAERDGPTQRSDSFQQRGYSSNGKRKGLEIVVEDDESQYDNSKKHIQSQESLIRKEVSRSIEPQEDGGSGVKLPPISATKTPMEAFIDE